MHARQFFIHPWAQTSKKYEVPARRSRQPPSEATVYDSHRPTRRAPPVPAVTQMMAETKVSLAADQLGEQVKESLRLWGEFQDEYSTEVHSIKPYVGTSVLRQIWRQKIKFHNKHKYGGDDQFSIQNAKLESCLNQIDEAIRLLEEVRSSGRNHDYDSRQRHLAKMQGIGNLVVGLSKKSLVDAVACEDLLGELEELEKLIGSGNSTASSLHRTDKRQSQNSTEAKAVETEGTNLDEVENRSTREPRKQNSNDLDNDPNNDLENDHEDYNNTTRGPCEDD
ncbi:hypothetical protein F5Y14DRAFT_126646 [Nemania sp. NC0429]|nr:hypothetical protein F5Y14DRAFT_126646 [Nemania sp. NC0429]